MGDDKVAIIEAGFRGFEAGEPTFLDSFDPDIEWEVRADLPDAGTYRGHDGVRRLLARFGEVFDDMWVKPEKYIPVGDEVVAVQLRWGARGRGSGVEFEERRETWTFRFRGSKVVQIKEYATLEQALEAAGAQR